MRTFLFVIIALITGIIILTTVAPLVGLVISLAIVYYAVRRFLLTDSVGAKIGWSIVALMGVSMAISNTPALIGIVAAILLYYTYRSYRKAKLYDEEKDWIID
ncbi:lmo0954 family membrane protein [Amphibacillus sediminis]|uniref:lmo0954 family membrane protein n=1 Tax=Amphibacillus sediminis TaxID=360185 RepID=UPI00082CA51A|nr:hypothetical protein [Amphibacillus sediminis]